MTKVLLWKCDPELEENPQRILKGASGLILNTANEFVFISFYDDEEDDNVFAGV